MEVMGLIGIGMLIVLAFGVLLGAIRLGGQGLAESERPTPPPARRTRRQYDLAPYPLRRVRGFIPNEGWPGPGDGQDAA